MDQKPKDEPNPDQEEHFLGSLCPDHGWDVRVDEDGCCVTCGNAAVGTWIDQAVSERKAMKAEIDRLRHELLAAAEQAGRVATEREVEIERLRAALKRYANPDNWTLYYPDGFEGKQRASIVDDDEYEFHGGMVGGKWARTALAGKAAE